MEAKVLEVMKAGYDYEAALVRMNHTQDEVDNLRNEVKDFSVVPKSVHDKHLLCFLLDGLTIKQSAERVKLFYEIKVKNPYLFKHRDPESKKVQQCLRSQNYFFLPMTPDQKSTIYLSLIDFRASSWHFDESAVACLMLCELCLCTQGPSKGINFLIDMKGASWSHLSRPNIKTVISMVQYAFYAVPAIVKAVHIFNAPSFFDTIMNIFFKPFIKKEFKNLLHLHKPDMNWEDFYTNCIPKSCLPSDYGGDLDSIEVMHDVYCKSIFLSKDYFLIESEQVFSGEKE